MMTSALIVPALTGLEQGAERRYLRIANGRYIAEQLFILKQGTWDPKALVVAAGQHDVKVDVLERIDGLEIAVVVDAGGQQLEGRPKLAKRAGLRDLCGPPPAPRGRPTVTTRLTVFGVVEQIAAAPR
jgi:hypothetical protein